MMQLAGHPEKQWEGRRGERNEGKEGERNEGKEGGREREFYMVSCVLSIGDWTRHDNTCPMPARGRQR